MVNCSKDEELIVLLKVKFSSNNTAWNSGCSMSNMTSSHLDMEPEDGPGGSKMYNFGRDFYGFATPVIVLVGLIGNAISLKVFTSKVMRRLSSSYYLAMLSASDMLVLLSYVFMDWLDKGLPRWPGGHRIPAINYEGMCHVFLFLSYTTRFSSVWLIVAFTGERYVAICHQRYRKKICSKAYARMITMCVCIISCVVCLFKPVLSGSYDPDHARTGSGADTDALPNGLRGRACVRNPNYAHLSFVLESLYGLLLTAIPSLLISGFSTPILRRLMASHKIRKESRLVFKENRIRLEFTIIFLSISSCFVALTIPYLDTWCQQFWASLHPNMAYPIQHERISGHLYITRTIFYLNYCINFFLYCMTGAYYRREIRSLLKFSTYFRSKRSQDSVILHG